jgi:hypothetical protein
MHLLSYVFCYWMYFLVVSCALSVIYRTAVCASTLTTVNFIIIIIIIMFFMVVCGFVLNFTLEQQ